MLFRPGETTDRGNRATGKGNEEIVAALPATRPGKIGEDGAYLR
jgi:hypothetical protein